MLATSLLCLYVGAVPVNAFNLALNGVSLLVPTLTLEPLVPIEAIPVPNIFCFTLDP